MTRATHILIALLLTLSTSYSFAKSDDSIKGEITASFRKNFQHAQIISTEVRQTYTKLTFKMNDVIMFAFYSENGELLAVTRNILSTQLPMNLLIDLKSDYSSYWITDLFELSGEGQDCYYITLENADSKITLCSAGDRWEVYTSSKKQ
jgi:hypothetical protein